MAGDWIKIRAALLTHPKVIAASRALHDNEEFRDWLLPGGSSPMNGQLVSNDALRCVTTALLTKVWSVAREHGEFVDNDLVLRHSQLSDIDSMAGAPGVGMAMNAVGWAYEENGVTLPNFKEFNVPMTPAEKQSEYRKRNNISNAGVTKSLLSKGNGSGHFVTTRVEREENKVFTSPSAPASVTSESLSLQNSTPVDKSTSEPFDAFWRAYPKKKSRGDAEKAWTKIRPDQALRVRIMATLNRLKRSDEWTKDDGQFIPYPASWLNAKGWEDQIGVEALNDWRSSASGITEKGRELGLAQAGDETFPDFSARVRQAVNNAGATA